MAARAACVAQAPCAGVRVCQRGGLSHHKRHDFPGKQHGRRPVHQGVAAGLQNKRNANGVGTDVRGECEVVSLAVGVGMSTGV